jgi:hypothetical protein
LSDSIFGQVTAVRKFVNGDIEVDFYHEDDKELIEILVSTLATDICIEIFFGDDRNPTHVELEECDDEDDSEDDEEFDDDSDLEE